MSLQEPPNFARWPRHSRQHRLADIQLRRARARIDDIDDAAERIFRRIIAEARAVQRARY